MKKIITIFTGFVLSIAYKSVFAQGGGIVPQGYTQPKNYAFDFNFLRGFLVQSGGLVSMLPALLMGIAVAVFFFFLIRYLIFSKNDDAKAKQKNLHSMMYSLIAIFIMVALWGIIAFAGDTLGINTNVRVYAPEVPQMPRYY